MRMPTCPCSIQVDVASPRGYGRVVRVAWVTIEVGKPPKRTRPRQTSIGTTKERVAPGRRRNRSGGHQQQFRVEPGRVDEKGRGELGSKVTAPDQTYSISRYSRARVALAVGWPCWGR